MKRFILGALVFATLAGLLAGCASGGRGQGPVGTFGFLSSANPALGQNAMGLINEQREPKEISVVVPPGTDMHALVATLSFGKEAVIAVISSGTRVVQQNGVTPNDFSVPVTYSIDVPGEKKPWTYTVRVREAETNARLGSIAIPQGAVLKPAFSPSVHGYTLTVLYASTSVRVEARGQASTLKSVTVDGTATPGAAGAAVVDFQGIKERALVIETLAEDGAARDRYTVTIRRGAPDNNALLGSLELQNVPLSPAFTPQVLDYQVVVPFETRQLALRARPQSPVAVLGLDAALSAGGKQTASQAFQFTGSLADKAGAQIPFDTGSRLSLIVSVTAEDGGSQQYLVDVRRAPPDSNDQLATLSVIANVQGAVVVNTPWSPARYVSMAVVPYATRKVTLMFQPQSRVAVAVLEQVMDAALRAAVPVAGDPLSKSGAEIDFDAPRQRVRIGIAVTAQDGGVQRYVVEVRRGEPDRNADLESLAVFAGVLGPAFSPRTVTYAVRLGAAEPAAKISASTASPVSTMTIVEQPEMKPARSVSLTLPVAPGGQAVITFVVSAEDGSQKLYRVQIGREAAPVTPAGSDTPGAAPGTSEKPGAGPQEAAQPGDTGRDHVQLSARNLKLQPAEANALLKNGDVIGAQARIIARYYRTNEIIAQSSVPVDIRQQGADISLAFTYRSSGVALNRDRLVEIETVIPTKAGHFLYYTEARPCDDMVSLDIPFLLYGDTTRTAWPAVGSPVAVSGYLSKLPPGKPRGSDKEEFEKNAKGESSVTFELVDARTGASYGKEVIWNKPGLGRDRALSLSKAFPVPEGAVVRYLLASTAKNGKAWKASGTAQVWTTQPGYPSGFSPVVLRLADELSAD
jgi:hypothetical protein